MQKGYTRKEIYSIENIFSKVVPTNTRDKDSKVDFDGDLVKMNSQRYELFKEKGIKCVSCGIEGEYFAKEKDTSAKTYHFNLYAMKDGVEVLMTKDHIIPKSKGGANHISNYQTMCWDCNFEKLDN